MLAFFAAYRSRAISVLKCMGTCFSLHTNPAIFLLTLTFICPNPTSASENPFLADAQAALQSDGQVRLVVKLKKSLTDEHHSGTYRYSQNAIEALANEMGMSVLSVISRQGVLVVQVTSDSQLRALSASPMVRDWTIDQTVSPQALTTSEYLGADLLHFFGLTGHDQAVAILDTGVDTRHPAISERIVAEACFSSIYPNTESLCANGESQMFGLGAAQACDLSLDAWCQHGTHVAGIAAGSNDVITGIAPQSQIVAVQIFHLNKTTGRLVASWSDILRALDWLTYDAPVSQLAAINISVGGDRHSEPCNNSILAPAISDLRAKGIATVVSSGNNGWVDAVTHPGCITDAITVGASAPISDRIAYFSNTSPAVDLIAPGQSIYSSIPDSQYTYLSGTSMSAPQIAGAFATLKNAYPDAGVDEMELALKAGPKRYTTSTGIELPEASVWESFHTLGTHTQYRYEMEDSAYGLFTIEDVHKGYSGQAYINTLNHSEADVGITLFAPKAGRYKLKWRYANGSALARSMTLQVNGTMQFKPLTFAGTEDWANWRDEISVVNLREGENALRLISHSVDGAPNLDYVLLNPYADVNHEPQLASPMADITLVSLEHPITLALEHVFKDEDLDTLEYRVEQQGESIANVSIDDQYTAPLLTVQPKNAGTARIVVSASDGLQAASTAFNLTVNIAAPTPDNLALGATVSSSGATPSQDLELIVDGDNTTFWTGHRERGGQAITLEWPAPVTSNHMAVQEVQYFTNIRHWRVIDDETGAILTRGFGMLANITYPETTSRKLSLMIDSVADTPKIAEIAVYLDHHSQP